MKKTIAVLLALVMALSLTACSKNETKKLVGTWQYAMELTEVMNEEMAESYELDSLGDTAEFCVYMTFTVAEDGAYTLGVDMDATGESLTGYYQALTPVLTELVYAAGEEQGMSREQYDAALEAMGMTMEEYISTIFSAVDMGDLLTLMLGSDAGTESSGWCKAVDGQLYMAETAGELDAAGHVAYTLDGGTMSWTDSDGQLSGQLTAQEQELIAFPMVWTKVPSIDKGKHA